MALKVPGQAKQQLSVCPSGQLMFLSFASDKAGRLAQVMHPNGGHLFVTCRPLSSGRGHL